MFEKLVSVLQIARVEPLGESGAALGQQRPGLGLATLRSIEPGQTHRSSKLRRSGLLLPCNVHGLSKTRLRLAGRRFAGLVPNEELARWYSAADVFCLGSRREGCPNVVLESLACGTPVVCSNVSSLPEVVGDAAEIVNPENVFDIARGMREVLLNQARRSLLVERGFEQARRFSWERTAQQVLDAYEEIGSYKKRPR